jgi:acyl-CoA synthetase (AMP-forming)/AMP-acid ligase II
MVVALCGPNSWQWIVQALAVQSLGCVLLPLSTRLRQAELQDMLQRSRASAVITVSRFLDFDYHALFTHLQAALDFRLWAWDWPGGEQILMATPERWPSGFSEHALEHAIADLMFTSGTTGRPKGVLSSQSQNARAFGAWTQVVGLCEQDRYLVVNPFFHAFGYKAGWLSALIRGACIYPMAVFDARAALATIERERISFLPGPPMLFHALLEPRSQAYFEQLSWRVRGELDVVAFAAAWNALIERHASLRSMFVHEGTDTPLQVVLSLNFLSEQALEVGSRLPLKLLPERLRVFA